MRVAAGAIFRRTTAEPVIPGPARVAFDLAVTHVEQHELAGRRRLIPARLAVYDERPLDRQAGQILLIACGALAREILALKATNGWSHMDLTCLPAKLHLFPEKITGAVRDAVAKHRALEQRMRVELVGIPDRFQEHASRPELLAALDLDADVNTVLRSWKVPKNKHTQEHKVTLRGLLSHTAGLTVHGFPGYARDRDVPDLVQVLDGEKPANTPGLDFFNTGVTLITKENMNEPAMRELLEPDFQKWLTR